MVYAQTEKRSMRRFALELPISVKFLNQGKYELTGRTRDVSSRGVYMCLNAAVAAGSSIEFVMTLPPEVTLASAIRVRCYGRVLRVETNGHEQGVAVAIDKYDFVGEE